LTARLLKGLPKNFFRGFIEGWKVGIDWLVFSDGRYEYFQGDKT